jgi:hypothetical protein
VCHLLAKPKCRTHPDAVRIEVELLGRRQHDAVIEDSDDEDDDEITIVATGGDLARIQQESAPMPSPRKPGCTGRVGHCRAVQSRSRSPA